MLEPKRRKFRKEFRGKRKGISTRGASLAFGEYGIKAQDRGWISARQIEAGRRTITHNLKKGGRVWVRIFPDKPVTARPPGHRMGGGKGDIDRYVAVVRPGKILYEAVGASADIVKRALEKAASKMPIKTRLVQKEQSL